MKKILITLTLLLAFAASASAQLPSKPFNIYIGGGVTMPNSPDAFKDGYKMGFHGTAGVGLNVHPLFQLVGKADFHIWSADKDWFAGVMEVPAGAELVGGSMKAILFGADVRFKPPLPASPIKPYLFAGGGIAAMSVSDFEVPDLGTESIFESTSKMYINFGGGVDFQNFFIQIRYLSIKTPFSDEQIADSEGIVDDKGFVSMPITVGIKF